WAAEKSDLNIDEGKSVKSALSFMKGKAAEWATGLMENTLEHDREEAKWAKWENFERDFKARWAPGDDKQVALEELQKFQQGKQRVTAYWAKFAELAQRAGIKDEETKTRFIVGLNPE